MKQAIIGKKPETTEELNALATNITLSGSDVHCVMLTSRFASEGKSTVSFALAAVLTSLGKRVVFIDTDLRRSTMVSKHDITFEGEKCIGLSHFLSGQCEVNEAVYRTNIPNLFMVPVGRTVSASLPLLSSERFGAMIKMLRATVDYIIIDTAPVGAIVDALEVAKNCDGALLVVRYKMGHARDLVSLARNIETTGCRVLGNVLNRIPVRSMNYRRYNYYSSYYGYKSGYYKPYAKDKT